MLQKWFYFGWENIPNYLSYCTVLHTVCHSNTDFKYQFGILL